MSIAHMEKADNARRLKFQAVQGYFEDFTQRESSFRARTLPGLGLIEREYSLDGSLEHLKGSISEKQWTRLRHHVEYLNRQTPASTTYKVLYITRHGLGFHNTFESTVGHDAWNDHWSHLDGDGQVVWADSRLNDDGIRQARELGEFWSYAVTNEGVPLPQSIYTSPLARCLETTRLEYSAVFEKHMKLFRPVVKEGLRELLTDHTCDRRSSRKWIEEHYPDFVIEDELTEEDTLWTGDRWETPDQHTARKQRVLEDIFATDENAFIALTTHSYAISAILRVLGLSMFRVSEGSCIALLVRADKM